MLSAARKRSSRPAVDQIGEAGKSLPNRHQQGEPVVFAGEMRARARPAPSVGRGGARR